jgi:hypothetical protein
MKTSWFIGALRELFGLFVDDVPFTVAILIWLTIAALGLPQIGVTPAWYAPLLFFGFAAILIGGAVATARRKRN